MKINRNNSIVIAKYRKKEEMNKKDANPIPKTKENKQ